MQSKEYDWWAHSPSKPKDRGLGFKTEHEARLHADNMNELIEKFDTDSTWNKEYWTEKPQQWVVSENAAR